MLDTIVNGLLESRESNTVLARDHILCLQDARGTVPLSGLLLVAAVLSVGFKKCRVSNHLWGEEICLESIPKKWL